MGFITSVIQPGETILFDGKVHWIVYFWPLIFVILGVGVMLFGADQAHYILDIDTQNQPPFFLILGGLIALLAVINLVSALFYRFTTEIAVTNRRVIFKKGFVWRKTMEMNVNKVESVSIDQTVLGRILDYGTVSITGTGSSIEPFTSVDSPVRLRNTIKTFDS